MLHINCSLHSCFLRLTVMQMLCMHCSVNSWSAGSAVHFILVFPRVPGTASCRKRRCNKYLLREWGGWMEEGKMHKVYMMSWDRAEAFLQFKGGLESNDLKPRVMMYHGKVLPVWALKIIIILITIIIIIIIIIWKPSIAYELTHGRVPFTSTTDVTEFMSLSFILKEINKYWDWLLLWPWGWVRLPKVKLWQRFSPWVSNSIIFCYIYWWCYTLSAQQICNLIERKHARNALHITLYVSKDSCEWQKQNVLGHLKSAKTKPSANFSSEFGGKEISVWQKTNKD